jgi:nucleoid-associated protein YgaU
MQPQIKLALAMLLLVGGAVGAFMFRKAPTAADASGDTLTAGPPSRVELPLEAWEEPEVEPHLVGRIDTLDAADTAPGAGPWHADTNSGDRLAGDPLASDLMPGADDMPAAAPWHQAERSGGIPGRRTSARSGSAAEAGNRGPLPRTHRIVDGDTLSGLATKYLGRADRFGEIYEANRDVLRSPDVLPLGAMLKIPSAEEPPPMQIGPMVPLSPTPQVAPPAAAPNAPAAPSAASGAQSIVVSSMPTAISSATSSGSGDATTSGNSALRPLTSPATAGGHTRLYRVQEGDTLTAIARRYFGDANRHLAILEANRDQLPDAAALRAGMVLVIPE